MMHVKIKLDNSNEMLVVFAIKYLCPIGSRCDRQAHQQTAFIRGMSADS